MTGADPGPTGFAGKRGKGWVLAGRWVAPGMMCIAYFVLMATSEVGWSGKAWEALGLAFVMTLWFLFRSLTARGAMARAVAVGDGDRVLELAEQRRGPARHLYRALAHDIRGEWPATLAELDRARPEGGWRLIAAAVRVGALVETGRATEARAVFDAELAGGARERDHSATTLVRLAEARLSWGQGDLEAAERQLAALVDDVRAGAGVRAVAHGYAARIAAARGDEAAAARHRTRAAELAPAIWIVRAPDAAARAAQN